MFRRILKLILNQRKRGTVVLVPNKYALNVGLRVAWMFDLDQDGLPIFRSALDKARWEMANGEYRFMFEKVITK